MESKPELLDPSKTVRVSYWNIIGWFPSVKNGKGSSVRYLSTIERDFMFFLEFDEDVVSYRTQFGKIQSWAYKGEIHHYTPDFEVTYKNHLECVECKPHSKLTSEHTIQQVTIGQEYCYENGSVYRVVTDFELREGARLENYKKIYRYRNKKVPMTTIHLLSNLFQVYQQGSCLRDILATLSGKPADNSFLPEIFSLLFSRFLETDFDMTICGSSIIRLKSINMGG